MEMKVYPCFFGPPDFGSLKLHDFVKEEKIARCFLYPLVVFEDATLQLPPTINSRTTKITEVIRL